LAGQNRELHTGPSQRIDKFLWFARVCKSRSLAQALSTKGIIRLNGRRVERAYTPVRIGDLITVPHGHHARVLRILSMPARRGPPAEAMSCYEVLSLGGTDTDAPPPASTEQ